MLKRSSKISKSINTKIQMKVRVLYSSLYTQTLSLINNFKGPRGFKVFFVWIVLSNDILQNKIFSLFYVVVVMFSFIQ